MKYQFAIATGLVILLTGCVSRQRLAEREKLIDAQTQIIYGLMKQISEAEGGVGSKALFAIGFENLPPEMKERFHLQALNYEECARAMAEADLAAGYLNALDYGCLVMRNDAQIEEAIFAYLQKKYDIHVVYIGWGGTDPPGVGDMAKVYNAVSIPAIEKKYGKAYNELYEEASDAVKAQKKD